MKLTERQIKRHRRTYSFFKWLLKPWICKKFAFSFKKEELPDAPYIILSNHNVELDPILLGMVFPHSYFVASEHLFNKGLVSKLLNYFFAPVPRMKGRADAVTVLDIRRRLVQGCNICIFPEGNRSLDGRTMKIHPATGGLVKSCKVPVVVYKFKGAYLSHPRWSFSVRTGKMTGSVVNIYWPKQLESLGSEEINNLIYNDMFEDAYQTQKEEMVSFKGKNLAAGLESALFLCPKCNKIGNLKSEGDRFFCSCGMNTSYNEYGYFEDAPFSNYTEWYDWQKSELKKFASDTYTRFSVFDSGINIYKIENSRQRKKLPYSSVKMTADQLILSNKNGERLVIGNQNITGVSIYSRNNILVEVKQDYYELKPDKEHIYSFNARKYLHLYEIGKDKDKKGAQ